MSLLIYQSERVSITQFHGGAKRGICYQVESTDSDGNPGFVQVRQQDFIDAVQVVVHCFYNERSR